MAVLIYSFMKILSRWPCPRPRSHLYCLYSFYLPSEASASLHPPPQAPCFGGHDPWARSQAFSHFILHVVVLVHVHGSCFISSGSFQATLPPFSPHSTPPYSSPPRQPCSRSQSSPFPFSMLWGLPMDKNNIIFIDIYIVEHR